MMAADGHGGRVFTLYAPSARVAELTVDFGGGLTRTLAMQRHGETWVLRLPAGLPLLRYRFRVDGRHLHDAGALPGDPSKDCWHQVRPAA
jgi:1,4-alpha-glucan branching enzyme